MELWRLELGLGWRCVRKSYHQNVNLKSFAYSMHISQNTAGRQQYEVQYHRSQDFTFEHRLDYVVSLTTSRRILTLLSSHFRQVGALRKIARSLTVLVALVSKYGRSLHYTPSSFVITSLLSSLLLSCCFRIELELHGLLIQISLLLSLSRKRWRDS